MNNEITYYPLTEDIGYTISGMPAHFKPYFDTTIKSIQDNFLTSEPYNHNLIGHINKEFKFPYSPELNDHLTMLGNNLLEQMNFRGDLQFLLGQQSKVRAEVKNSDHGWINFQSKHEFNPLHVHDGVLSYVFWYQVPYTQESESKTGTAIIEEYNKTYGHFQFVYYNGNKVNIRDIPVSREWEGAVCVFPAFLNHQVYPFHSSDEYRISISGNMFIKGIE